MDFLGTLSRTVSLLNVPFGYTLTIWASGVMALSLFGIPSPLSVILFMTGAIGGYLACAVLAHRHLGQTVNVHVPRHAVLNVASLVAVGVVALLSRFAVTPEVAYAEAGFASTSTYILCLSALRYGIGRFAQQRQARLRPLPTLEGDVG